MVAVPAAGQARRFDVPAGSLAPAIVALGRQAGVTIATTEPDAARIRVRGVRGATSVDAALRTMLAGSGFAAVRIDGTTFVVRRVAQRPAPPPALRPAPPPNEPDANAEIVVTAAKVPQRLKDFAGTAHVLLLDEPGMRNAEPRGTGAIVDQLPVMASTGLGPGRDKLFVRGIADSSFTGTSQATVGQYLGEIRLNYNAPDPDLALYDMARVELLEGPQATLYGAGSLGGILRLVPRRPAPGSTGGSVTADLSFAANGRFGSDLSGVLNLSLGDDSAARLVAYAGTTPGLVDDSLRRRRAVGRSHLAGGRAALDTALGDGWSVELAGAFQRIDHDDARYAEGRRDPPTRASAIAQPAANRFALGAVTLRRRWDSGLDLVSATAVVDNDITARYDLSTVVAGVSNDSRNRARVVSNETRLSRSTGERGGWVIGIHGVASTNRLTTTLDRGPVRLNRTRIGTGVVDAALFGQATVAVARDWTATLGGRLSYSEVRILGDLSPFAATAATDTAPLRRGVLRVLPSSAIGWHPRPGLALYAGYQRGYRVGGLTVIPFVDPAGFLPSFEIGAFRPDSVDMVEAGLRFGRRQARWTGSVTVSATHWRDIQADLADTYGSYTSNLGDARILGLEASATWQVDRRLRVSGAAFVADSARIHDVPVAPGVRSALPNIPLLTARLDVERSIATADGTDLLVRARLRYVGRSRSGVEPDGTSSQGDYLDTSAGVESRMRSGTVFAAIDNLLNVRGNRFGVGNPFAIDRGDQRIPLQPRTVRFGIRRGF